MKFLNDVGGGIVTGFTGKNTASVMSDDGFEIPYPVGQLINVSDPDFNKVEKTAKQVLPEEKFVVEETVSRGEIIKGKDSPDFYFCFVPSVTGNPLGGETALHLVNDSNFTLLVNYSHFADGKYRSVFHDIVFPNSDKKLESIDQSDLSELPEYCFQLLYFGEDDKELHEPVTKKFKISPVKFYKEKSFQANRFFDKNAMVYQITENILNTELDKLTDDDFKKVVKAKEIKEEEKRPAKTVSPEIVEVDLHIHQLIDNTSGLSNKEILDIQMDKVERETRSAIQSGAKKIVFIHGVGQGVLKQEVSKLLKRKFPKYSYHDASFKEYGYGATMVILRK